MEEDLHCAIRTRFKFHFHTFYNITCLYLPNSPLWKMLKQLELTIFADADADDDDDDTFAPS